MIESFVHKPVMRWKHYFHLSSERPQVFPESGTQKLEFETTAHLSQAASSGTVTSQKPECSLEIGHFHGVFLERFIISLAKSLSLLCRKRISAQTNMEKFNFLDSISMNSLRKFQAFKDLFENMKHVHQTPKKTC